MFINYEYGDHVYSVTVEKRGDQFFIIYNNNEYTVTAEEIKPGLLKIKLGDNVIKSVISEGEDGRYIFINGDVYRVKHVELTGRRKTEKKEGDLNSPISGTVVKVNIHEGDHVKKDDILLVIEAMKMEYLIRAPYDGIVKKVYFKEKDQVEIGQLTVEIEKGE